MKVQVFFLEGCPNHGPTVELARRVVREAGLEATVEEVEVKGPDDATRLRFLGSPTIRVDGVDIDPATRDRADFGLCCRTYDGKGVPPRGLIERALMGHRGWDVNH